jgi:hypothetical protein
MRASAHCPKNTTGEETQGTANLGNPSVTCQGCCHTDVSLILYKQYSTFLFKIHNKLARWMKTDLSGPKNNYYWSSLGPQQQQHQ